MGGKEERVFTREENHKIYQRLLVEENTHSDHGSMERGETHGNIRRYSRVWSKVNKGIL